MEYSGPAIHMTVCLEGEAEGGDGRVTLEAETVVTPLQAKDHQGSLETSNTIRDEEGFSLWISGGAWPCQHLDSGLGLGELVLQSHETPHSEVLSHPACDALLRQL